MLESSLLQVHGLAFSIFDPNMLASGGLDGRLCIWDLATLPEPKFSELGRGRASPPITHLSWNPKAKDILAVCYASGTVAIWNLKTQQQQFTLHNPAG